MRPPHPERARSGGRSGFALPLALFFLLVVSLLAAIVLGGAVHELRIARGEFAGARAQAAAGSALADFLATRPDSAALELPRGAALTGSVVAGAETTRVAVQSLGNGIVRVTATARAWSGGVRGDAANLGLAGIVPDSTGPRGSLRYRRLPGWWWAPLP